MAIFYVSTFHVMPLKLDCQQHLMNLIFIIGKILYWKEFKLDRTRSDKNGQQSQKLGPHISNKDFRTDGYSSCYQYKDLITSKRNRGLQSCEDEKDLLRTDGFKSPTSCITSVCNTGADGWRRHQNQRLVGYEWLHL